MAGRNCHMNYQAVFDVTKSGFDWTFGAFGLIFVIVGTGLVRYRELIRSKTITTIDIMSVAAAMGLFLHLSEGAIALSQRCPSLHVRPANGFRWSFHRSSSASA